MPLKQGQVQYDIEVGTAMILVEHRGCFEHIKDAPYLKLMGELWGVSWDHLKKFDRVFMVPYFSFPSLSLLRIPTHLFM